MTVKVKKKKMTIGETEPALPLEKLAETVSPSVWPPLFATDGSKFESEAITFFHRIHCRECQRMEEEKRAEQAERGGVAAATTTTSVTGSVSAPGNSESLLSTLPTNPQPLSVEDQSLQHTMDINKESLKRKLMLRRSVTELVDQGIYPPLTTPVAYAEQRKQLERAKTGDLLRQKLKMRPDRQSLVQHHILEDTKVDPSLQDAQKLLKKARLQDSLNDRLANRPGPLELVEGNILETDPQLKDAIKEGKLHFTKTSDLNDAARRHFKIEPDEAGTSESASSPPQNDLLNEQALSPLMIPTPPDIMPLLQSINQRGVLSPPHTITFTPISTNVTSPTFMTSPPAGTTVNAIMSPDSRFTLSPPSLTSSASNSPTGSSFSGSRSKNMMKKPKIRPQQKQKVIKFHEYKGPPSVVKNQSSSPPLMTGVLDDGETPYNVLLQQQQLLLQWQLEMRGQGNNLPIFLSTAQQQVVSGSASAVTDGTTTILQPQPLQQIQVQNVTTPISTPVLQTQTPQQNSGKVTPVQLQQKAMTSLLTPVATPIPVMVPSPVPVSTGAPLSTIVASIPAGLPAQAIPASTPVPAAASMAAVNTTFVRTVVTTTNPTVLTSTTPKPSAIITPKDSNKSSNGNILNNSFKGSFSNNRPPITKLDDLKVAELKNECKKRSLPVSKPKPKLLEKLKPFADEIVAEYRAAQIQSAGLQPMIRSTSSLSNMSSRSSHISSDNSLQSPPSVSNFGNLINIQPLNDDAMSMTSSPPMSPSSGVGTPVSTGPMSPENMDVFSPFNILTNQHAVVKKELSSSQTIMPMTIDPLSRPGSVVPMDTDQNNGLLNTAIENATDFNQNVRLCQAVTVNNSNYKSVSSATTVLVDKVPPAPPLPPPPPPPLPTSTQIITIRPQGTNAAGQQLPPTQIQVQGPGLTPQITAQIRAQFLQQMGMMRLPSPQIQGQQVIRSLAMPGQSLLPGSLTVAQPRPVFTQVMPSSQPAVMPVNQPAMGTRPVSMVPQIQRVVQVSSPGTQLVSSVQTAPTQAQYGQTRAPQSLLAQRLPVANQIRPHQMIRQPPAQGLGQISQATSQVSQTSQQSHIVRTSQASGHSAQTNQPTGQLIQPIGQPAVLSNEELVRQQQKQIEELRNLLIQTQLQLNEAQQKAQLHNEQLKLHLARAQIQGPDQAKAQLQAQAQAQALSQAQAHVQALAQAAVQLQQVQTGQNKVLSQIQAPMQVQAPIQVKAKPVQLSAQTQITPVQTGSANIQPNTPRSMSQTPSPNPQTALVTSSAGPAFTPQTSIPQPQSLPLQQTLTMQPISSMVSTNAAVVKTEMKPVTMTSLLQSQNLSQSVNLGPHKLVLTAVQPNGQQYILTPSPPGMTSQSLVQSNSQTVTIATSKPGKVTTVTLNGITSPNNKSSSVPSSPVGHSKLVRSATNPFFIKEPPKYDEAIKNKQNLMGPPSSTGTSDQSISTSVSSTITTTASSTNSLIPFVKSEFMDDVLDILIANGELPPSAAQEPPPTPKVTDSNKVSMATDRPSLIFTPPQTSPRNPTFTAPSLITYPGMMSKNMHNTETVLTYTNSALSTSEAVMSIANGLKASGPSLGDGSMMPSSTMSLMTSDSRILQTSPAMVASITSPLSNQGSPLGSDSGVGSSVGRKELLPPLSISPAISNPSTADHQNILQDGTLDFPPFMDWSDSDFPENLLGNHHHDMGDADMCVDSEDNKDIMKQLNSSDNMFQKDMLGDLNCDDFFRVPTISINTDSSVAGPSSSSSVAPGNHQGQNCAPSPSSSSSFNTVHSEPNLRDLPVTDLDMCMIDAHNSMNIDVSDWLDVVMPPSGLTPTVVNPPSNTFSSDPILTPKSQEFLDLFNLVESDLYTPTDTGMSFEKVMEASTSHS